MSEEGMLSIIPRGTTYAVHYAASDPHAVDYTPYRCPDDATLRRLLRHCGCDPGAIQQAGAELRQGRMAVLPLLCPPGQLQAYFSPLVPGEGRAAVSRHPPRPAAL